MARMHFKPWSTALLTLNALFFPVLMNAICGYYEDYSEQYYTFVQPKLLLADTHKPLFFTVDRLYDYDWNTPNAQRADNLAEWRNFVQGQATTEDLELLIYTAEAETLSALAQGQTPTGWASNSAVKAIRAQLKTEAFAYLSYAKQCESINVIEERHYWEELRTDQPKAKALIAEGQKLYTTLKANWLKLRVAYQMGRLAHYHHLGTVESLYKQYAQPLAKEQSLIQDWILSDLAGAIHAERPAEAVYLFAKIYDRCPSRRVQAYYSFRVADDDTWNAALALCQNKREQIALYFLRAIKPFSNSLEEMDAIWALDPNSEYLETLLVREINKLEYLLLNKYDKENFLFIDKNTQMSLSEKERYLHQTTAWVRKAIDSKQLQRQTLWQIAHGYLQYLALDYDNAQRVLDQALASTTNPKVQKQIRLLQLAIKLSTLEKTSPEIENQWFQQLMDDQDQENFSLQYFYKQRMAILYAREGQGAKAFLSNPQVWGDVWTAGKNAAFVDELLDFVRKPNKTTYEEVLMERLPTRDEAYYIELKAAYLIREDRLKEAAQWYAQYPEQTQEERLPEDPFYANFKHNNVREERQARYTRRQWLQKMLEYIAESQKNGKDAAQAALLVGHAYYNLTWFGNSWHILNNYRSSADLWLIHYYKKYPENASEQQLSGHRYDQSLAIQYYTHALELAKRNKQPEIAAEALFMIAKCQQNTYYIQFESDPNSYDYSPGPRAPLSAKPAFEALKNYRNTKYVQQAIGECWYLDEMF